MPTSKNRRLAAILFADMNERFLPKGKNESPVDFQAREPRSGWAEINPENKLQR